MTDNVAAQELRSFVERYERLEYEKQDIANDQKELMADVKGRGYCTKTLRTIISQRKKDADTLAEEAALLEMYQAALNM